MAKQATTANLTSYEAEQVRQIATWKSQPPHPFVELVRRITLPPARFLERLIPDSVVASAINRAYDVSYLLAGYRDTLRKAGISELTELQHKPLEVCDRIAIEVGVAAQAISVVEGALTGAGGVWTTLLDIPLLLILSLRTILKVGHCYGYALDELDDRRYVISVLVASLSGSLESKRERVDLLHELEDLLFEQT
jgi:hypothetical protein